MIGVNRIQQIVVCVIFCTGAIQTGLSQTSRPTDFGQFSNSLEFVPADASFYWSSTNNGVKWNAVVSSKAFQELAKTQAAKALWKSFTDGFSEGFASGIDNDQLAAAQKWFQSEQGKQTWKVLVDSMSEEVFVFGDEHWSDVLARTMSLYGKAFQYGMANPNTDDQEVNRIVWQIASEEFADAEIPAMLIGGKLSDVPAAKALVGQLFEALRQATDRLPEEFNFVRTGLRLIDDQHGLRLVFNLNSEDIPWDRLLAESNLTDQEKSSIIDWWKGDTLSLTVGVYGKFLVFGSASNEDFFASLGSQDLLVDSQVLQPLKEFRHTELSSVSYLSAEFMTRISKSANIGEYYKNMFKGIRNESGDFEGNIELAEAIESDVDEFAEDIEKFIPRPGAYLEFSFITEAGIEGYTYNWSENMTFDGSRPLTILQHVDGDPAFLLAARSRDSILEYEFIEKYCRRVFDRVVQFGPESIDDPVERREFVHVMDQVKSLLSSVNRTNKEKTMPALKDGQSAIIMDFKFTSNRWFALMPDADEPLPIPSIAILLGVSDAELLKDAMRDYFHTADSVVAMLREIPEANIPGDFAIPRPEQESLEDGTMYFYSIPDELGLNEDLMPNMALNQRLAVLSLSPVQSRKLLTPTPLIVGGPLEDIDRPMTFAVHYNNRATIEAIEGWANYGMQLWFGFQEPEDFSQFSWSPAWLSSILQDPGELTPEQDREDLEGETDDVAINDLDPADLVEFGKKGLTLLKCFESYTAAGYLDGDAQVTHFLFRFRDIEE